MLKSNWILGLGLQPYHFTFYVRWALKNQINGEESFFGFTALSIENVWRRGNRPPSKHPIPKKAELSFVPSLLKEEENCASMVDANAIVSFALGRLEMFGDFLSEKVAFLQGVRDEVVWLKKELQWMQSFLKDAEKKQDGDTENRIRRWITDVRDVAYDAEDVIDTFILKVEVEGYPETERPQKRRLLDYVMNSIIGLNREIHKEIDLYNIGKDIEALKKRVADISRRRQDYGLQDIGVVGRGTGGAIGNVRQLRRTSSYADEDYVVGLEVDAAKLIDELLKEEPGRCVISIWGMGGLGKTTLARKLYHHNEVVGKFECRAWICVSQEYKTEDLLRRIIKSFKQSINREELELFEKMELDDLERHLRGLLGGRQYLVVMDDMWDKNAWEILKKAFPDNKNGSRVIVTTRNEAVARSLDGSTYVHQLRLLGSDESWELFCKKAFPNGRDPRLEKMGREMVAKCRGLPLAIIVLGGLLRPRKEPYEWAEVKKHIWRNLVSDSIDIKLMFALSFNDLGSQYLSKKDLGSQLKACFLYLGLFPEDFEINTEDLIRLWVAEGFIPQEEGTSLEEVADDWLNELIGRSLIQVARRNCMRITACRVHDLLRDLAVQKAKELEFFHIYDENMHSSPSSSCTASSCRRHAHFGTLRYDSVYYSNPCLRTLLFPNVHHRVIVLIVERFKLLRVLDLKGNRRLPDEVGELIHLRYLGLRNSRIDELPSSLFNLKALETLDASSESGTEVSFPGNICGLKQMRHLIGKFVGLSGLDHLTNLQTLKPIYICDWVKINSLDLINLRDLTITGRTGGEPEKFSWKSIANLRNLQSLSIMLSSLRYFPSIQPLYSCQNLLQLRICGRIETLPEQMDECLPNLKFLVLDQSELLQDDPMPTLEKLPNLMVLHLRFLVKLKKLNCTAEGFPRLEVFVLKGLDGLEEWEVEEGAMPMLKGLQISRCAEVTVPERLRSIQDPSNLNWDWDWDLEW